MSWFDDMMDTILMRGDKNYLGDVGKFLGGEGIGKAIEDWSNPITQMSDRNPLLALSKGEGNLFGSYKPQGGSESTLNNLNAAAALIYGGYGAMGGLSGGNQIETMGLGTGAEEETATGVGSDIGEMFPETKIESSSGLSDYLSKHISLNTGDKGQSKNVDRVWVFQGKTFIKYSDGTVDIK
jgi:hypothetical protein